MPNIEELAFLNAIILGKDRPVIDLITATMAELHPYSSLLRFADIEKLKKQLTIKKHELLIIDLQNGTTGVNEFIIYCKKKYPKLKILIIDGSGDISIIKDFFEIGINGFVSAEISAYELTIALQKMFSGEKYVGTGLSGKLISSFFSLQKRG